MSVEAAVPADAPVMKAWTAYKLTPEYENTKRWALRELNTGGSLWAAFVQGFVAAGGKVWPEATLPTGGEGKAKLHPATAALVNRFACALAEKLAKAEQKYGYTDGWASDEWEEECRRQLPHHVLKGDPLDVAAYAAFCFHHGWSTAGAEDKTVLNSEAAEVFVKALNDPPEPNEALWKAAALYHIRALLFAARTSGGVAGPDDYLMGVCARAEAFMLAALSPPIHGDQNRGGEAKETKAASGQPTTAEISMVNHIRNDINYRMRPLLMAMIAMHKEWEAELQDDALSHTGEPE